MLVQKNGKTTLIEEQEFSFGTGTREDAKAIPFSNTWLFHRHFVSPEAQSLFACPDEFCRIEFQLCFNNPPRRVSSASVEWPPFLALCTPKVRASA